jgi:hypothetical protein
VSQLKPYRRAGTVIAAASVCWGLGIAMVGNVHAIHDPAVRLSTLERHRGLWILGQFLAAAGTAAAPLGFARFAQQLGRYQQHQSGPVKDSGAGPGPAQKLATASAAAFLAGSPMFVVTLAGRAADIERFAYRRGPAWPFLSYAGLQTFGIGALGGALLLSPLKGPTATGAAASAPLFAAILLRYKDLPPFVFYAVELAAGIRLMRYAAGPETASPRIAAPAEAPALQQLRVSPPLRSW